MVVQDVGVYTKLVVICGSVSKMVDSDVECLHADDLLHWW